MGCCCSDPSQAKLHKANTSSNDITQPMDLTEEEQQDNIDQTKTPNINTPSNKSKNGKDQDNAYKDIGKGATTTNGNGTKSGGGSGGGTLQIEITDTDKVRKRSWADKYLRSNAQVAKKNQKKQNKKNKTQNGTSPKVKNGKSSPGGSKDDSNGEDYLPPIPNEASNKPYNSPSFGHKKKDTLDNPQLSLLGSGLERSDTKTYGDENRDVVSPIPILDNQMRSITNVKRPSTSALSSPLNSVRLSITPKV